MRTPFILDYRGERYDEMEEATRAGAQGVGAGARACRAAMLVFREQVRDNLARHARLEMGRGTDRSARQPSSLGVRISAPRADGREVGAQACGLALLVRWRRAA